VATLALQGTAQMSEVPENVLDVRSFWAGWRRGVAANDMCPLRSEIADELALLLQALGVSSS